jgi:hypothetical protein
MQAYIVSCGSAACHNSLTFPIICCDVHRLPRATAPAGSLALPSQPTWTALCPETTALTPAAWARTQPSWPGEQHTQPHAQFSWPAAYTGCMPPALLIAVGCQPSTGTGWGWSLWNAVVAAALTARVLAAAVHISITAWRCS